ncbi:MAG: sugar phosphate isomerase/epimerase [Clostridia bacterium]|nr:sugar phosphate isomerase/epimerase [Clostridia bacterium]
MKLCFSTLGCTERSLVEVLSLAKGFPCDALELRGLCNETDVRKMTELLPENRRKTKNSFREYGVSPLILGTSCTFHDASKLEKNLEEGFYAIDAAHDVGFYGIRVFGNSIKGDEGDCLRRIADGISALCRYASDKNVAVLLETHGDINTEERLGAVAEICGKYESFGILWDVCHTRRTYGEHWRDFCNTFGGLIRHVHLKDVSGDTLVLPGKGDLPLRAMAEYLTAKGYEGYFSLEWEKKWHPELPMIEDALSALAEVFKE